MRNVFFAMMLTLVLSGEVCAQPGGACEPRAAIGAAASLLTIDLPIDPVFAAERWNGLARDTGLGLEGSVNASIPISSTWSLTAEFGAGRKDVEVYGEADGPDVRRPSGDALHVQRLAIGLTARRDGRYVCGYASVVAGPYRFSYRDTTSRAVGGIARLGLEGPAAGSMAVFFELDLAVAFHEAQAPLVRGVIAGVRPTLGLRYRF